MSELTLENLDGLVEHLLRHLSDTPLYQHYVGLLREAARRSLQSETPATEEEAVEAVRKVFHALNPTGAMREILSASRSAIEPHSTRRETLEEAAKALEVCGAPERWSKLLRDMKKVAA